MNQEKRVAVVTDAAQGIGRRVAEVLSGRGSRLALNDLCTPAETIHSIQSAGGEAIAHLGIVADQSVVDALARGVYDTWGRTDVLVNNARVSFILTRGNHIRS